MKKREILPLNGVMYVLINTPHWQPPSLSGLIGQSTGKRESCDIGMDLHPPNICVQGRTP
jgi:hypothetical protein